MNYASEVAKYAVLIWGDEEWPHRLEEILEINPRTISRIKKAHLNGEDYAAARGVLTAMADYFADLVVQMDELLGG